MRRRPIETTAVATALQAILRANAEAAAEENVLVARDEAGDLHPYLFERQRRMREEGGPGTRIRVDALVQRAMADAQAVWDQVNPPARPRDHRWLALDEVAAIHAIDPHLAALTEQALAQARADRGDDDPTPSDPDAALRALLTTHDFAGQDLHANDLPQGERIDARPGEPGRAQAPEGVQQAVDYYLRAETAGWGTLTLHRLTIEGATHWVLYVTGPELAAALEILDEDGTTTDGARLHAHQILAWDEFPGRVRLVSAFMELEGVTSEEGLSEPDERAAAGQPPSQWPGEAVLDSTTIGHVGEQLGVIDFGGQTLSPPLRELATAAIDHLWDMPLRYGIRGEQPVALGPQAAGVLSVGSFTRPTTGQTYEVANWRDIDDASFVLYYLRGPMGLQLAISQFDN